MRRKFKNGFFYLTALIIMACLGNGWGVFSQPISKEKEGKDPQITFGKITFLPKEVEAKPHPLNILEVQIEVINRSRRFIAPPNTIRVVVIPKEVVFGAETPLEGFNLAPEEATLNLPLPPGTGRILILGFPLPKERLDSITFEIQINPPEGEVKVVIWRPLSR